GATAGNCRIKTQRFAKYQVPKNTNRYHNHQKHGQCGEKGGNTRPRAGEKSKDALIERIAYRRDDRRKNECVCKRRQYLQDNIPGQTEHAEKKQKLCKSLCVHHFNSSTP